MGFYAFLFLASALTLITRSVGGTSYPLWNLPRVNVYQSPPWLMPVVKRVPAS